MIRVPKALPPPPSTTSTSYSSNPSLSPSTSPNLSKKNIKRQNILNISESDGAIDTAKENDLPDNFQKKKQKNQNPQILEKEAGGKSAVENDTDGGGKDSPDSGGMDSSSSKSATDEKLAE